MYYIKLFILQFNMSSKAVKVFYLVDRDNFDNYLKNKEYGIHVEKFPLRIAKRVKQILTLLSAAGLKWNILGNVTHSPDDIPLDWNVLEHSAYAVTGNGQKPSQLLSFLKLLSLCKAPLSLLCMRLQSKLKKEKKKAEAERKAKRKNGKTKNEKEEKGESDI